MKGSPGRAEVWILAALYCALAGPGCDACDGCARAMDPDPPERQLRRDRERYIGPWERAWADREQRARQAAADRYRDQIVPGVGCEKCPDYCTLVDLRPLEYDEFARQFRKLALENRIEDLIFPPEVVIEWERLRCILISHDMMDGALSPLMDYTEHPRVRLEAAIYALLYQFPEGDPADAVYELAEGSGPVAGMARRLIEQWDGRHWPYALLYDDEKQMTLEEAREAMKRESESDIEE